ncbi:MAG: ribulose-phosphate 3-epimerase [Succinivibrio dextrinosolvens]|uniref:ribulose-phosphate 3-epimerase n=1 Tax=Succinivibrio sp. TaxID=2053619 RepID=UPI0025CE056F|nr:ribulose-phosphate 3-epimerase [Succinivibrio sp.]MBQ9220023.1 ribulose-phosphate 3-epimerase [Succinivibrio sp.]MDY6415611.1 ribulose-phosphate 3-epimerase [Succinivibrio dextrinosolvens]MDY6420409.1 ribulose-phosphate 3-epimerase [Succinivibrio dextrinosolvens]MDY6466661.1 ribulose-phosphate 3-epimerase [Succinivibrio dextrinosolvens]
MKEKNFLIAGSILSADLLNLERDVKEALDVGVDVIHFDVMDYHFVPNMTFGPAFLKAMRKKFPDAVFDVHLMVTPVTENIVDDYAKAGASWISFHPEACVHTERMLTHIQEMGIKAGIALNPSTPPQMLRYLWDKLDFVLVMTVNPGFGGQSTIPATLTKVSDIKAMAKAENRDILIEVDGGVKSSNIKEISSFGAEVFVVGSAFFGTADKKAALSSLHSALA